MTRTTRTRTAILACASALALTAGLPAIAKPTADAGSRKPDSECQSGALGKPMSERAQKQLLKAIDAMDGDRLDEALAILDRISTRGLGNFGMGLAYQMRAGIAASRDDLEGAATYMQKSVDSGGFCGERLEGARLQLGQLLMAVERWDDAIAQLQEVIASSPTPNGEAYYRIGLAQYRAERLADALASAEKAVSLAGSEVKEPWLLLLLQIHWDREEFEASVPILRQLVVSHPKRDYWLRLGFALFELKRPEEALVAMQLGDRAGQLEDENDQLRLVQLEFSEDLPIRAAQRLEQAIEKGIIPRDQKSLEILSNTWLAARDRKRSIGPLEQAADMSKDGRNWLRVAQIRAQLDDWKEVARAVDHALGKGSLEEPGMAYLLLGMAHYNMKDLESARTAFTKAQAHEKTQQFATTWLAAINEQSPPTDLAGPTEEIDAAESATN